MTNWPQLYAETHADWVATAARARTAERWLLVHRWIFAPLAFAIGTVIGHFV